jgi:hypothetical protein
MVKKSKGNNSEPIPEDMTAQEMTIRLLQLITKNQAEEEQMRKILEYALKVFAEPGNLP